VLYSCTNLETNLDIATNFRKNWNILLIQKPSILFLHLSVHTLLVPFIRSWMLQRRALTGVHLQWFPSNIDYETGLCFQLYFTLRTLQQILRWNVSLLTCFSFFKLKICHQFARQVNYTYTPPNSTRGITEQYQGLIVNNKLSCVCFYLLTI